MYGRLGVSRPRAGQALLAGGRRGLARRLRESEWGRGHPRRRLRCGL